jgi:tRNA-splicing ligase RtcB
VDVFSDEIGRIWVGVHFGSRGFGHTVASGFLALSQGRSWGDRVPETEVLLDLGTPLGDAYWALMNLAGEYAYAGREWVARKVVALIGGNELDLVHNHHNFAWKEHHDGEEFVVVRKGATPAFPGQRGFVGGSMGDNSVILEGATGDTPAQRGALYSTVHGAGRVLGRMAAKKGQPIFGEDGKPTGQRDTSTIITRQMMSEWTKGLGVIVRGGDVDEAPQAYRRLPDVLAAQGDTVRVLHTLTPLVVVMAGSKEYDPYKD